MVGQDRGYLETGREKFSLARDSLRAWLWYVFGETGGLVLGGWRWASLRSCARMGASDAGLRAFPIPRSFLFLGNILQIIVTADGRGSGAIICGFGAEKPGWLRRLDTFWVRRRSGQAKNLVNGTG